MWIQVLPGVLAAVALLVLPGTAVLLALRTGPTTALLVSPAVSLALTAIGTLCAHAAAKPWHPGWTLAVTVVAMAGCICCRLLARRVVARWAGRGLHPAMVRRVRERTRLDLIGPRAGVQYAIGAVISWAWTVPVYLAMFRAPTTIGQRFDNAFHLNAIEAIVRTGRATPMDSGAITRGGAYPNGWHTAAAGVQELTGLDLAPSVHALTLVVVLLVWPASMSLLVELLVRPGLIVRLATPVVALAFPSYPLGLLGFGIAYPYILGIAVAPVLAALGIDLLRRRRILSCPVRTTLTVTLAGIGTGIAHPSAAITALLVVLPFEALELLRSLRALRRSPHTRAARTRDRHAPTSTRRPWLWSVLLAVFVLGTCAIWVLVVPSLSSADWRPFQTLPQAIGEMALGGGMRKEVTGLFVCLTAGGVLLALTSRIRARRGGDGAASADGWDRGWDRQAGPLLALLCPGLVYLVASAVWNEQLRTTLSGFLYTSPYRAAAAMVIGAVPLALSCVQFLAASARHRADARFPRHGRIHGLMTVPVALVLAAVLAVSATGSSSITPQYRQVSRAYDDARPAAILLDHDERTMMQALPDLVPKDGYVVADPWKGGGLVYAFGDREASETYMLTPRTDQEKYRDRHLDRITEDPAVCAALPTDRPLFYLDLDPRRLNQDDITRSGYTGMARVTASTPGFTLIHTQGTSHLYRIDAC
jgi:hypothetical protein